MSSPLSPTGQQIPIITSSSQGGVTTRHLSAASGHRHDVSFSHSNANNSTSSTAGARHDTGPSAALLDRVRALDSLPRLGALRTLDLKGNDLRVSGLVLDYPMFCRR
jgi:protein phosphatase 1 regulatory subunit 37